MWWSSIELVNKYLVDEGLVGFWYGETNMNTNAHISTEFNTLDAFLPGTLALSGDIDHTRRLQESCSKMWTTFSIEPEELDYSRMKITYNSYTLRPKIIESTYYLHHFTNKSHYRKINHTFFDSLVKYCRTETTYYALHNIETKEKSDQMESFF